MSFWLVLIRNLDDINGKGVPVAFQVHKCSKILAHVKLLNLAASPQHFKFNACQHYRRELFREGFFVVLVRS